MKKSLILLFCLVVLVLPMAGCMAHTHIVGNGGSSGESVEQWQWYAIWGLVPLNNVDTREMAGGASDYTIKTQMSIVNIILNIFTEYITVESRTVTVTK